MGVSVNNDLFAGNSWYFRNAFVRANYRDYAKQIEPDIQPPEKFFRNLLLNESHELKNRHLLIAPPPELMAAPETEHVPNTCRAWSLWTILISSAASRNSAQTPSPEPS